MSVSRDEAKEALSAIKAAGGRVRASRSYADAAPTLILWGTVWLCADLFTQFASQLKHVWAVADAIGLIGSVVISIAYRKSRKMALRLQPRWALTYAATFAFIVALFAIMWPFGWKQSHAFWGIFIGWIYFVYGIWTGSRFVLLGAALAMLSLIAYFFVTDYYPLFMGVVGGGGLIVAGVWLWRG